MFDFSDRVAVVTGASGALGAVVARRLFDAGASLALVDRDIGRLPALSGPRPRATRRPTPGWLSSPASSRRCCQWSAR